MKPGVAAACLLVMAAFPASAHAGRGGSVADDQQIATLLGKHKALKSPAEGGKVLTSVDAKRPITGVRTVLPVLTEKAKDGRSWLEVRLPGRERKGADPPRTGWISESRTRSSVTDWHIVVDVHARRVEVYRDGRRLRKYPAIVGKRSTPTPDGDYFVEENVKLSPKAPGAPFALATSARSKVLQEFEGGPGQIALHGLDNIGGKLGTAVSHGCVRLDNKAISWLAARIEPGVPVTIK